MSKPVRILIVDDSEDDSKLALRALRAGGFDPTSRRVQTAAELESALAQERWDAVISDFRMPGFTGMDALGIFRSTGLDIPFILISGTIGESTAVEAMKAGANDYIMKQNLARLAPALERELKEAKSRTAHRRAQEDLADSEERFRQMAENIDDVFVLRDLDGSKIHYVSPAYEQVWGRTCASLYANPASWMASVHPDDRDHAANKCIEAGDTGFDCEFRIVRPDGEVRCIHFRGYPILDDAGNPYRIAGIASDVTRRKQAADELRQSESLKGAILRSSLDSVITIDHEGRIVEFNPAAEAMFGLTRERAFGKDMAELIVPPHLRDAHRRGFARYLASGEVHVLGSRRELSAIRADGSEFPIELAITALGATSSPMFTAFIHDITSRKQAEARIKGLNRVHAMLSGITTLIVRVSDRNELFREASRIAVEEGGFRMAWIGMADREAGVVNLVALAGDVGNFFQWARLDLVPGDPSGFGLAGQAIRAMKPMVSNEIQSDPERLNKDEMAALGVNSVTVIPLILGGEAIGVLGLHSADAGFFDEQEMQLLQGLAGDIAFAIDHLDKQERLDYLAYYDSLTGLANRSLFLERVTQHMRSAVSAGHKLALFLLDLERFRNINDSLGRPAGDALLRQVAQWLTRNAGDANLLARVGADHFAVVLPNVELEGGVAGLLEKLMEAFREHPFALNDAAFRIALKVGVALFPDDGADADTLFKNAEAALKKAKAGGDRYLFYTQKMTEMVAGRLTIENQLRQALEREEFVLHYQPKVRLENGLVTGAEALIRWSRPGTGLVAPGGFIPVLEETGLIHEVGRWALRKTVQDYLRWRATGRAPVRIAVNVSPLQLRSRGFVDEIKEAIAIDAHAAAGLELEITESVIMEDVTHNIATLQAIRALGVTVAIDDFGTGFSSLSYLSKLPVDTLKIDRSFVIDMNSSPQGLALVSTIITLAHSLKLKVVAEGVETDAQSRLLRLLNCDEMQGYLFSKAVPIETFEERFLDPHYPGGLPEAPAPAAGKAA